MKLALTYAIPSPELEVIAEAIKGEDELTMIPQWSTSSHTTVYDVAMCVGPVTHCPLARRRILFVFGMTKNHLSADWDIVVVTSESARKIALRYFGYGPRIFLLPPPLSGLHLARRRIVDPKRELLHASEGGFVLRADVGILSLWADLGFERSEPENLELPIPPPPQQFSLLEFNSRIKAGAIGFYPKEMEDGFDLQVRRHLALGGPVICRRDPAVIGSLAEICHEGFSDKIPEKISPANCAGNEETYRNEVRDLLHKI